MLGQCPDCKYEKRSHSPTPSQSLPQLCLCILKAAHCLRVHCTAKQLQSFWPSQPLPSSQWCICLCVYVCVTACVCMCVLEGWSQSQIPQPQAKDSRNKSQRSRVTAFFSLLLLITWRMGARPMAHGAAARQRSAQPCSSDSPPCSMSLCCWLLPGSMLPAR